MSSTIIELKDPALSEITKSLTVVLQGRQVGDFAKIAYFQRFETLFQIYWARVKRKVVESTQVGRERVRTYPNFDRIIDSAPPRHFLGGNTTIFCLN